MNIFLEENLYYWMDLAGSVLDNGPVDGSEICHYLEASQENAAVVMDYLRQKGEAVQDENYMWSRPAGYNGAAS